MSNIQAKHRITKCPAHVMRFCIFAACFSLAIATTLAAAGDDEFATHAELALMQGFPPSAWMVSGSILMWTEESQSSNNRHNRRRPQISTTSSISMHTTRLLTTWQSRRSAELLVWMHGQYLFILIKTKGYVALALSGLQVVAARLSHNNTSILT